MNQLAGTITRITARKDASGNTVKTVVLEVHGDVTGIYNMMDVPLKITVEPE